MTDYFALLHLPRRPLLAQEQLKENYHQLARGAHPDRPDANETSDFAAVNEAYRVLSDQTLRLQHLLRLEGHADTSGESVPDEFIVLFTKIGTFVQTTDRLLERATAAHNALSKSLLRAEVLNSERQAQDLLRELEQLHQDALDELRSLNDAWAQTPDTRVARLSTLYQRFAYLKRWIDQLRERQFQLANR